MKHVNTNKPARPAATPRATAARAPRGKTPVIVVCGEPAGGPLWERLQGETRALARRDREVHLFCPSAPELANEPGLHLHPVGASDEGDLVEQSRSFSRRVRDATKAAGLADAAILGYEWRAIPALLSLGNGRCPRVLSLESLELQRSRDVEHGLSARIDAVERQGLTTAEHVLIRDPDTAEAAQRLLPGCGERLVYARQVFPRHEFASSLDPAEVKRRYQVGPVDPTILFVGDLDDRHGPDLLMKAMPAVLKNHAQARLIVVGDGPSLWPLRVQSRYMLLDHAVRLAGDVSGQALRELIAAVDLVVVPSRVQTEDWPILAGWAAGRPVVATHEAGDHLCRHEEDALLVYPDPTSCVWGIERLLFDPELAGRLARRGQDRLEQLHGLPRVAAQLEELLVPPAAYQALSLP